MDKKISLLLIVLLCFSCQNNQVDKKSISSKKATSLTPKLTDEVKVLDTIKALPLATEKDQASLMQSKELAIKLSQNQIQFKGIPFKSTKANVLSILGQPDSIVEPKYECGPFSEDWQEMKFYQYFYETMNFIVYQDQAEIHHILFEEQLVLEIKGIKIRWDMSIEEVARLLDLDLKNSTKSNRITIYPKEDVDSYYYLEFEEGRLYQFDRYEPC